MRRHWPRVLCLFCCSLLAPAAAAQHEGVRWQQDLEAAKTLARQTGRLVLVHFWTPSCAPCVTLDQNVFNQPGVASAIEAQFVPVKLNANDSSDIAQGFGISRVPTDVVITPDGEIVGKLISPPTPAAYVGEVSQIAGAHRSKPGSTFARSAARSSSPSQMNAAYANLSVSPAAQPAIGQSTASQKADVPDQVSGEKATAVPLATQNQYIAPPTVGLGQTTSAPPHSQPAKSAIAWPAASAQVNAHVAGQPPVSPSSIAAAKPETVAGQPPTAPQAQAPLPPQTNSVAAVGSPDSKELPPGAPPLGFDGYCPVSMRNHWKWVAGDPKWGIVHRGQTYWFAGQSEQQQFWTDPDRYSPALSGMDPVMSVDHQQQVPGKREHSIDYDNLFYLFCSEATLQQFTANPERYAVGVRQAMGIPRGRLVR
jgi:YHS domain-containing protein/thiol-disulfide isomerase/thioredoxin